MFRILGNICSMLSWMAAACAVLVVAAVILAFGAIVVGRARDHAVLRAIGASPGFLFLALWMELGIVLAAGVIAGIGLGWAAAASAGAALGSAAGLHISVTLSWADAALAAAVLAGGLVAAAVPALSSSHVPPRAGLKR